MNSTWTFENQSIFPVLALLYKSSSKLKITLLDFLPIQHNSVQQTVNRSMQANDIQSMYFLCIRPQITTCLSVCLSVCPGQGGGVQLLTFQPSLLEVQRPICYWAGLCVKWSSFRPWLTSACCGQDT